MRVRIRVRKKPKFLPLHWTPCFRLPIEIWIDQTFEKMGHVNAGDDV